MRGTASGTTSRCTRTAAPTRPAADVAATWTERVAERAWLRTRDMPELDKLVWTAGAATKVPSWIIEDRRSRTAFNRNFYKLYKDLPARELKRQAEEALPDFIQPRIQHEAVRRIREHKRRGDRVICPVIGQRLARKERVLGHHRR